MKAGKEHRVPLSDRAATILMALKEMRAGDFVFPGTARGKPLSEMAMAMQLRRMKADNITVHGFRFDLPGLGERNHIVPAPGL